MITTRSGYIELPLPHLDTVVQTIRASVYGKQSKDALEMRFRKSALYDLMKGSRAAATSDSDDSLTLFKLWSSKPEYINYCVDKSADCSNLLSLLPTQETAAQLTYFAKTYFPERYSIFEQNADIVGGMVDALGYSTASAVFFGTYDEPLTGRDIVNSRALGLTPAELFTAKEKGIGVINPLAIKQEYLTIKKATGSVESIMFAAGGIPSELAITVINHNINYLNLMEIIRRGDSTRELKIMFDYDLDPFLMKALTNAASLGFADDGFASLSIPIAA